MKTKSHQIEQGEVIDREVRTGSTSDLKIVKTVMTMAGPPTAPFPSTTMNTDSFVSHTWGPLLL